MQVERAIEQVRGPVWAWLMVLAAVFAFYLAAFDNGAVLQSAAATAHEFLHDGRHFVGVPCH